MTSALKPRREVLEATPIIIETEGVVIEVKRKTWRQVRARALRKHTISAGWACLTFSTLIMVQVWGLPDWLIAWNAVSGFISLAHAMHGWRYASEKTVRFIVAVMRYQMEHANEEV